MIIQQILQLQDSTDKALDFIYQWVDEKMWEGSLAEIDYNFYFVALTASDFTLDVLLGLLTASLPVKTKLQHRPKLVKATHSVACLRSQYEPGLMDGLW